MSLMAKDKQLFQNYNKIWGKNESLMRKNLRANFFMVIVGKLDKDRKYSVAYNY